jgi:hypothetical protein
VQMLASSRLGLDPKSRAEMEGSNTRMTVDLDAINQRVQKVLHQRYANGKRHAARGEESNGSDAAGEG